MSLPTIEILGKSILLNIVHHDSGEKPESLCTNTLVCAKVGELTFQCLNVGINDAVKKIAGEVARTRALSTLTPLPEMLTIVVSQFHKETTINWKAAISSVGNLERILAP